MTTTIDILVSNHELINCDDCVLKYLCRRKFSFVPVLLKLRIMNRD